VDERTPGFDLDMTLVDTSEATAVAVAAVNRRLGTHIDTSTCVRALGAPMRDVLAGWVPADLLDAAMRVLATAFVTDGMPRVRPMPGAAALLDALRGTRVIVARPA